MYNIDIDKSVVDKLEQMGYDIVRVGIPVLGESVIENHNINADDTNFRVTETTNPFYKRISLIVKKKFITPEWLRGFEVDCIQGDFYIINNGTRSSLDNFNKLFNLNIPKEVKCL